MKIKALTTAVLLIYLIFIMPAAFAESGTIVTDENFALMTQDELSTDWIVDISSGAGLKNGEMFIPGNGGVSSAAYEIPLSVKPCLESGQYTVSIRIKPCGARGGVVYIVDLNQGVLCEIKADEMQDNVWNDLDIVVVPDERMCEIAVNGGEPRTTDYVDKGAAGAAAIRFFAADSAAVSVAKMSIIAADGINIISAPVFSDVSENSWAKKYITRLAAEKIMIGTGDNMFSPESIMTSAEVMVVLCRIFDLGTSPGETWYSGAREALALRGADTFRQHDLPCERKDLCTAAMRLLKQENVSAEFVVDGRYADLAELTQEERQSILELSALSVVNGVNDTEFDPHGSVTREQAAKIFCGVIDVRNKK